MSAKRHKRFVSACGCREAACPHIMPGDPPPEWRATRSVLSEIAGERMRQDAEWGGAKHDDTHKSHDWLAYIAKHLGRGVVWPWDPFVFRAAMVKVAGLAVAAIEWADRGIDRAVDAKEAERRKARGES